MLVKALFHPVLDSSIFLYTNTKVQWVELFPMGGIVMIFAIIHVVEVLLYHWLWAHGVLFDNKQQMACGSLLPSTWLRKNLQHLLT